MAFLVKSITAEVNFRSVDIASLEFQFIYSESLEYIALCGYCGSGGGDGVGV